MAGINYPCLLVNQLRTNTIRENEITLQTTINTYACISKPTVQSKIAITDWLNQIKYSKYSELITSARDGVTDKNTLKGILPCVTYNFLFENYKSDKNIIKSTGLIFIDLDKNLEDFNINQLDLNKIYSYYHSIGGIGYSLLVRVDGVSQDNFKSSYQSILTDLHIEKYADKGGKKKTQFNVLSFDPDIYINDDSFIYNSTSIEKTYPTPLKESKKEEHIGGVGYEIEKGIRYNNISDFSFADGEYIENWKEGFHFVNCYLPTKKIGDKRKRTILSYLSNLIWLNPNIEYYHAVNILENINKRVCATPLSTEYLVATLKSVLAQKNENRLYPHFTTRRILFNPNSSLNVEDKLNTTSHLLRQKFARESCDRINDIIEDWDFEKFGKISIEKIAINSNINKKTVAKYYHLFKEFVNGINQEFCALPKIQTS
ncbi:BT4734/BF3469 family protein [Pedobacter sp. GSP4]|uniref:BT4734/BF3469 family protein n=1 Tax=Pedobacter sp. GSP4 TaxID=3453716 RepID=UPI003EE94502